MFSPIAKKRIPGSQTASTSRAPPVPAAAGFPTPVPPVAILIADKTAPSAPPLQSGSDKAAASEKTNPAQPAKKTVVCIPAQSARAHIQSAFHTPRPRGTPSRTPGSPGTDPCASQTNRPAPASHHPPTASGVCARAENPPPAPTAGRSGNGSGTVRNARTAHNLRKLVFPKLIQHGLQ